MELRSENVALNEANFVSVSPVIEEDMVSSQIVEIPLAAEYQVFPRREIPTHIIILPPPNLPL